jgi:hypothetical protein
VTAESLWKSPPAGGHTTSDGLDALEGLDDSCGDCIESAMEIEKLLADRAFDYDKAPAKPHPVLMLGENVISTPGNLTNLQGLAKTAKSSVIAGIIASVVSGGRGSVDTLGFKSGNPKGKKVLHFDTEQSRYDHDSLVRLALKRGGAAGPPEPWLESYCLTDLSCVQRLACIDAALDRAADDSPGILMVIIDGVADLCSDPNNAREAFELVDHLHTLAIVNECAIITVLHENPGSDIGKMRGHLGSQLERKAETALRLAKDAASGIVTIWAERARHCMITKDQGTCIRWDDKAGMHVCCGTQGQIRAGLKHQQLLQEAQGAFGDAASLSYTDLWKAIMEFVGLKADAAKKRVASYQSDGITEKCADGSYRLKIGGGV